MKDITKTYTNGEVTIVWQPAKCIHSALCVKGLPEVFDSQARPWIKPEGATTERLIAQINACPSGALSYQMNDADHQEAATPVKTVVEVLPNGPLLVYGTLLVKDRAGNEALKTKTTAFCRCGASANKPYCDGAHAKVGFTDQ
jgi:uncharacterized Fe-S cluster protein YjdI